MAKDFKAHNIKILKGQTFSLPKSRENIELPEFLQKTYSQYFKVLGKFEGEEKDIVNINMKLIENFCASIVNCSIEYYKGFPNVAFNVLNTGLNLVNNLLLVRSRVNPDFKSPEQLFRIRQGNNNLYSKEDMFHIPFEKREMVKTQRFSIPGLPCLYLGNTIYLCWEELRRPDINQIQISRFEIDLDEFTLLNLSMYPQKFNYVYELFTLVEKQRLDRFTRYIVTWPIVLSCSLKTLNDQSQFKPEHIIPQLVLQWVCSEHKMDGIMYFSSRIDPNVKKTPGSHINFVLPAKEIEKTGHCKYLKDKTKITSPISWQIHNIISPIKKTIEEQTKLIFKRTGETTSHTMKLELPTGVTNKYFDTAFGILELELMKMKAERLK
jgi:hypothetical protein